MKNNADHLHDRVATRLRDQPTPTTYPLEEDSADFRDDEPTVERGPAVGLRWHRSALATAQYQRAIAPSEEVVAVLRSAWPEFTWRGNQARWFAWCPHARRLVATAWYGGGHALLVTTIEETLPTHRAAAVRVFADLVAADLLTNDATIPSASDLIAPPGCQGGGRLERLDVPDATIRWFLGPQGRSREAAQLWREGMPHLIYDRETGAIPVGPEIAAARPKHPEWSFTRRPNRDGWIARRR